MWLEGVRFPDMVRWGDTDGVKDNGKNIPTAYDAFFTKGEPKHRIYVEYSNPNSGTTGFIKASMNTSHSHLMQFPLILI